MKKLIYILIAVVLIFAVAYTLMNNKKEMAEEAAVSEIKSDAISVQLTTPKTGKIDRSFTAQGNFAPIQSLTLQSETQGQINRILKRKGEHVRKGDLLIQVESGTINAELQSAQANFEKAERDLKRFENLSAGEAITKRQLEDARLAFTTSQAQLIAAKKRLANTSIKAPIDGEINEIYVEVGSFLSMGTKLYDIVNVDRLKLNVKVGANEILMIKKGDQVKVKADLMTNQDITGTVTAIAAQADKSLKYDVEIEFANPSGNTLRAGMYGTAYFEVSEEQEVLLIPREAIVGSLQNPSVYVVQDSLASLRQVVIGTVTQDQVEVIKGVEADETIVQSGQINLRDGVKVIAL